MALSSTRKTSQSGRNKNIASFAFLDPELPNLIIGMLSLYYIPAEFVILEITEGSMIKDPDLAMERLTDMEIKLQSPAPSSPSGSRQPGSGAFIFPIKRLPVHRQNPSPDHGRYIDKMGILELYKFNKRHLLFILDIHQEKNRYFQAFWPHNLVLQPLLYLGDDGNQKYTHGNGDKTGQRGPLVSKQVSKGNFPYQVPGLGKNSAT